MIKIIIDNSENEWMFVRVENAYGQHLLPNEPFDRDDGLIELRIPLSDLLHD